MLDRDKLGELLALKPDGSLLERVLLRFRDLSIDAVSEIGAAIEREDADGTHRAAHSLKSAAGTIGAVRMCGLCSELEHSGKGKDLALAAKLVLDLERETGNVVHAIDLELRGRSS